MNKTVAIVGPTATGKTDLAISLCKKFNGEIISVDSRQAYKEMNVGTGKSFGDGSITIHLYDLVKPDERSNAHDYATVAWEKIKQLQTKKKVPFLVGGTGFYMDVILGRRVLEGVEVDPILRKEMESFSLNELIKKLQKLNPEKVKIIDKKNKYRLIRAIEIAQTQGRAAPSPKINISGFEALTIGLTGENNYLYGRADRRVNAMIEAGLVDEVNGLVQKYGWEVPGLKTLGYREFKPYFAQMIQLNIAVQKLKFNTHAYIRRQKTYFKKYFANAHWFDISTKRFEKKVEKEVESFLEISS